MLKKWSQVEAAFRREYGIRLADELDQLTWREFIVLASNLQTVFVSNSLSMGGYPVRTVSNPRQAERVVRQMLAL